MRNDTRRDTSYIPSMVWVYNTNIIQEISLTRNADRSHQLRLGGRGLSWGRGAYLGGGKAMSLRRSRWVGRNVTSTVSKKEVDSAY